MDEGEWNESPADFAAEWAASDRKNEVIYEIVTRRGKFRLTTHAIEALQADLAAAERRGYLRGLEEAAGVAEHYNFGPERDERDNARNAISQIIATAIRALKDKQP